jgi:alpha-soluble NSF attachment protein
MTYLSIYRSGSSKLDDACELYIKAANHFKMAKLWIQAGKAYCCAADIQLKQNTKHEAASYFNEASNSFKKTDPHEALQCLLKSCDIYIDMVLIIFNFPFSLLFKAIRMVNIYKFLC